MDFLSHHMQTKTKRFAALALIALAIAAVWLSSDAPIDIQGDFSRQDIADLRRLARGKKWSEIKYELKRGWPTFREVRFLARRAFSERVVKVVMTHDRKALVYTSTSPHPRPFEPHVYLCRRSRSGWEIAPAEFE